MPHHRRMCVCAVYLWFVITIQNFVCAYSAEDCRCSVILCIVPDHGLVTNYHRISWERLLIPSPFPPSPPPLSFSCERAFFSISAVHTVPTRFPETRFHSNCLSPKNGSSVIGMNLRFEFHRKLRKQNIKRRAQFLVPDCYKLLQFELLIRAITHIFNAWPLVYVCV